MQKLITLLLLILFTNIGISQTKPTDTIRSEYQEKHLKPLDTLFLEKMVLEEINNYRKERGLHSFDVLVWNDTLADDCRKHSQWVNKNNKFMHHTHVDEDIRAPERIIYASECLARMSLYGHLNTTYQQAAARFVYGWKKSPRHNAILLMTYCNMGGIGISVKNVKTVIITYRPAQNRKLTSKDPRLSHLN